MYNFWCNNLALCFSELHPTKEVPALARISADEFKDIVMQKLKKKPVVVVFAEESVSL
jgi:thioredoxin-like negative regulator of GroEL